MAKKDKEQLEAEKKLKAAEKSAPKKEGKAKSEKKKPRRRGWFKRFRGETKKITWPDGRTVVKSTGVVIVTIIVVGSLIWVIDWGLGFGLGQTLQLAAGRELGQQEITTTMPSDEDYGLANDEITQPSAETTVPADVTEAEEVEATEAQEPVDENDANDELANDNDNEE
ncbi:MAG: preprotein translocase subunit SecE [Oscillospiraceae bacterium]|nr:preprotein translocase subunit SecE [Oscillospiraceae bacterium]